MMNVGAIGCLLKIMWNYQKKQRCTNWSSVKKLLKKYNKNAIRPRTLWFSFAAIKRYSFQHWLCGFGKGLHTSNTIWLARYCSLFAFISCINLSISLLRSFSRAKEIGIRKTLAVPKSNNTSIFKRDLYYSHSTILSVWSPHPDKNVCRFHPQDLHLISAWTIHYPVLNLLTITVSFLSACIRTGVIKVQAVSVLKNQALQKSGSHEMHGSEKTLRYLNLWSRSFLSSHIYGEQQIHYMMNKDLGYKKEAYWILKHLWYVASHRIHYWRINLSLKCN